MPVKPPEPKAKKKLRNKDKFICIEFYDYSGGIEDIVIPIKIKRKNYKINLAKILYRKTSVSVIYEVKSKKKYQFLEFFGKVKSNFKGCFLEEFEVGDVMTFRVRYE